LVVCLLFGVKRTEADVLVLPPVQPSPPIVLPTVLANIAKCESQNKAWAKNASSTASGRFQFIKKSWNYYGYELWGSDLVNKNVFDFDDNTELALYVYKRNGTRDWLASKHCWSKM
jgi:hypothetical protein